MATRYWTGETDTDFEVVTNWSDDTMPVDGDTIYFDGRAEDDSTTGNKVSCLLNLDRAPAAGVNFAAIYIQEDFTGDIGDGLGILDTDDAPDTGTALQCTADKIIIRGTGTYYFNCFDFDETDNMDLVIMDSSGGTAIFGKGYHATAAKGRKVTKLINVKGTFDLRGATGTGTGDFQASEIDEIFNITSYASTNIRSGGTSTTLDIYHADGTVYMDSKFVSYTLADGTAILGNEGDFPAATVVGTLLTMYGGAVTWRILSTLTTLTIYNGTITATGSQAKILTNSSLYGGKLDLQTAQTGDITVSNAPVITGLDAEYLPPKDDI